MEKLAFIVERLNMAPFNKAYGTMTEFDGKSSLELLEIMCEIIVAADPEQESIFKESIEFRCERIIQFLQVMKFNIPEEQFEDFQKLLLHGDKEILHTIMHWCLHRFDHLRKRAYLAKYLMPVEVPSDYLGDELITELLQRLKDLQVEFKEVHKNVEQVRSTGTKPAELKAEIQQLDQERAQLENKIKKMQKDMNVDADYFKEMLKATSALRKEQENEVLNHERLREHRKASQEAEMRYSDASRRLNELKKSGVQSQSAEQILVKLHQDVKDLAEKKEHIDGIIAEREMHLEKLQGWDNADRVTTDEDVRNKREQAHDLEEQISILHERLDSALENNPKLIVFRQASTMALKKCREQEEDVEKLAEDLRRITRLIDEKEAENKSKGNMSNGKLGKKDLKKYGAVVREKIERYKKMKEELSSVRSELVILQRTEQVLKSRTDNLEQFLEDLEKKKGIEGYRETQRALIEMTERTVEVDQIKGSTLEDISTMVEQIGREFRNKQTQLQPLISELKATRVEYIDVESEYQEKKATYDKVAVGLDMEKQGLEKECNTLQDDCLREESRYHYLQNMIFISRIKLEKAEQEKKWLNGHGKMLPDFASLKALYESKLSQQDQLTKQLRKKQKELKENSGVLTNQKTNFSNLQSLLMMKLRCVNQDLDGMLSMNAAGPKGMRNSYGSLEKANSSYDVGYTAAYPEATATYSINSYSGGVGTHENGGNAANYQDEEEWDMVPSYRK